MIIEHRFVHVGGLMKDLLPNFSNELMSLLYM